MRLLPLLFAVLLCQANAGCTCSRPEVVLRPSAGPPSTQPAFDVTQVSGAVATAVQAELAAAFEAALFHFESRKTIESRKTVTQNFDPWTMRGMVAGAILWPPAAYLLTRWLRLKFPRSC